MWPKQNPYFTLSYTAFVKMLTYRLRYYTGVLTYTIYVSTYYFIWKALFSASPTPDKFGFTLPQMVTYIAIGWIQRSFYFNNIDNTIAQEIQSGMISNQLIRPLNYQLLHFAQGVGECFFRLLLFTIPISIVVFLIFPIQAPHSFINGSAFLLASIFSFIIYSQINFIVGVLAIWLTSILGIIRIKETMIQLLSGLWIPIIFFPESVIKVFQFLPFQAISYIPLQIYLGKVTEEALWFNLGVQLLWCVVLTLMGMGILRVAIKRIEIYGG